MNQMLPMIPTETLELFIIFLPKIPKCLTIKHRAIKVENVFETSCILKDKKQSIHIFRRP